MSIEQSIRGLALLSKDALRSAMEARKEEMRVDDVSHHLIYQVLGVSSSEGQHIDEVQNGGRLLYRHAGTFIESATKACFAHAFPGSGSARIDNPSDSGPKKYQIDCLVGSDAIEIKWRDATTDGDHTNKEREKLEAIQQAGFRPVRLMFFAPNREQAKRIQRTLEVLYKGLGGEYLATEAAWTYVRDRTGVDLKKILIDIAAENFGSQV